MKNDLFEKAKQAVAEEHGFETWKTCYVYRFGGDEDRFYRAVAEWMCNEAVKADRKLIGAALDDYAIQYEGRVERNEKYFNETFPIPFPQQPDGI